MGIPKIPSKNPELPIRSSLKMLAQYSERHISKDFDYHNVRDLRMIFNNLTKVHPTGFKPTS